MMFSYDALLSLTRNDKQLVSTDPMIQPPDTAMAVPAMGLQCYLPVPLANIFPP